VLEVEVVGVEDGVPRLLRENRREERNPCGAAFRRRLRPRSLLLLLLQWKVYI
jgi:hypothetical protein